MTSLVDRSAPGVPREKGRAAAAGAGGTVELGGASQLDGTPAPGGAPSTGERARGRVPDFFIVGHPKSGTTALYEMLRRHPQIYMPDLKEPSVPRARPAATLPAGGHRCAPGHARGVPGAVRPRAGGPARRGGVLGLPHVPTGAGRIAELQPRARIIAILREPASFLRSLHLQLTAGPRGDRAGPAQGDRAERARAEGRHVPPRSPRPDALRYSERVRYVEQLRRYHAVFAPRAGAGVDLRRLPRRQRGDGAPGAALP